MWRRAWRRNQPLNDATFQMWRRAWRRAWRRLQPLSDATFQMWRRAWRRVASTTLGLRG